MELFTKPRNTANISAPSPNDSARYWRIVTTRRITTAYEAVFLCVRLSYPTSIMSGLNEHAKAWPVPCSRYANLFNFGSIMALCSRFILIYKGKSS